MQIPELSFPYPTSKTYPPRKKGQGCTACVHKRYCGFFYWHIRFEERVMPPEYGVGCGEWSNNKADIIRTKGEGDFYQVEKMGLDGIAAEPNQNGADDYAI